MKTNYEHDIGSFGILKSFSELQNKIMEQVPSMSSNREVVNALNNYKLQLRKYCTNNVIKKENKTTSIDFIEEFTNTVSELDDLVLLLTPQLEIAFASQTTCEFLGYAKRELIGNYFQKLLPVWDNQLETNKALFTNINKYDLKSPVRKKISDLYGNLTWFELKVSRLNFDASCRDNQGFLVLARNVEDQVKKEDILKHEKRVADSNNKLKSEFLANMSHEIRTPLNGIVGFSNILTHNNVDDDKRKRFVRNIDNCSKQLLTLINDIIDLSKIEAGQLKLNFSDFDLHALLEDLKLLYINEVTSTGKRINIKLKKSSRKKRLIIKTDEVRLRQVLMNLLTNALKYTEQGSIDFGYSISKNGYLHFFVKDTGDGVPTDFQPHIFDAYQQAGDLHKGNGLGLAISKSLVEKLNGTIKLDTYPGKGTEFSFSLPISA
ncbi:MAG: PAS domain-containing sensor histidine kinase [Bacteroidales bacterium]|nr:PAS domain-containing sensor histidine kinase [Bacteroidales bacterium]